MTARWLGVAETVTQAQALAAHRAPAPIEIIAAAPIVDDWQEQAGRPRLNLEQFTPETDLLPLGDANNGRAEALCARLDEHLARHAGHRPERRFVSFRAYFHPLKGLLDGLTYRAVPLMAALRALQPVGVLAFTQDEYVYRGLGLLDKPPVSLTSRLAPLVAQAQGIAIHWLRASNGYEADHIAVEAPARRKPASLWQRWFAPWRGAPAGALADPRAGLKPDTPLLIHNLSPSFGESIVGVWRAEALGVCRPMREVFDSRRARRAKATLMPLGQALWQELRRDPVVAAYFAPGGVTAWPLAEPFLKKLACEGIPDLLAYAATVDAALAQAAPAVLAFGGMEGRHYVVARVAGARGIPVVSCHFGGFLGFSLLPMHERYDLAEADYFLVGGPGCVRTFANPCPQAAWNPRTKRAVPVALGLPWVEELVERYRTPPALPASPPSADRPAPATLRLMYVMSALAGDNHYLNYVYLPEVAYWRLQRRLVETIAAFSNVRLILKPPLRERYPQLHSPLLTWVRAQDLPQVEIVPNRPLTDCADLADAFIVDSPSSPLIELAATDKPLILYIERSIYRLAPAAEALLRRRTHFADSEAMLLERLHEFCSTPSAWARGPVDDAFLHEYCTRLNDGGATRRAARFLRQAAWQSAARATPLPMESHA